MQRWFAISVCCIGLLAGSSALAEPGDGGRGRPPGGGPGGPPIDRILERHAERLGIDEETRIAISQIAAEGERSKAELRSTLRALHEEQRSLLALDAPDEAAVMRQAERIGAAELSLQKLRLKELLRIRALLTPEQRQELVAIHAEHEASRGRRPGDRRGPHGPPPGGGPPPRP